MGAYMKTYGKEFCEEGQTDFQIEQGQEMGKDGKVKIEVAEQNGIMKVRMTGTAVFAEKQSFEV